jgi:hypothetical protein
MWISRVNIYLHSSDRQPIGTQFGLVRSHSLRDGTTPASAVQCVGRQVCAITSAMYANKCASLLPQ